MTPTDVYIIMQPECAEGYSYALMHTFGCIVYILPRVSYLYVLTRGASYGLSKWNGQQVIPSFFMPYSETEILNLLTLGYQSDHLLLADGRSANKH